jgi:hypothetical protein
MRDSHWLCLDCSKDTFDEYYGVRDYLWRRAVDRSQRHGMLCLSCLEQRLGRLLRAEDFRHVNECVAKFLAHRPIALDPPPEIEEPDQPGVDDDDSPMDWDDYGIIDELTSEAIDQIDSALRSLVTTKPKKVSAIIVRVMSDSPARVPGLPDYFYLDRVCLLVEKGAVIFIGDLGEPMKGSLCLP